MKIRITSVIVDNQEKALAFYTSVLGFVKKQDLPVGDARWLTVTSPEGPDDIELLLEPNSLPASKTFQQALYSAGIPFTAFAVDNIEREYQRLSELGVIFRGKPTRSGPTTVAVFEDTCGNLIQLYET